MNQTDSLLNIQTFQTSQGVPVYWVRAPELPMIDVRVIFRLGSAYDGEHSGIAGMTCRLMDQGTSTLSADEIAKRFDEVGAQYGAGVSRDFSHYSLRSLNDPAFLKQACDTMAQLLSDPAFETAAVERIRKQQLTELEEEQKQPSALARKALYKALYPTHPYGRPLGGEIETVTQITDQAIKQFYERYYVLNHAFLVILRDASLEQVEQIAEQLTANLRKGEPAPALPVAPAVSPVTQTIQFPSQQTTICLGKLGIAPKDPAYFPLLVGNYTLGGGGMVSRLFQQVREEAGLVYGVYSQFKSLLANGLFQLKLQTRNEEGQRALDLTRNVLQAFVQTGPSDDELAAAKKNLIGAFPLRIASNRNVLSQLVQMSAYQLPLDYLDTWRDHVASVSAADIRSAFQTWLDPDELLTVMVGDFNLS